MKKLLFMILLYNSSDLSGQHSWGLNFGGMVNTVSRTESIGMNSGLMVGLSYCKKTKSKIAFSTGLVFCQKGVLQNSPVMTDPISSFIGNHDNAIDIQYLKFPVLFKIPILSQKKIIQSIQFGIYGAFRLNATQRLLSDNRIIGEYTSSVHEADWGMNGLYQIEIPIQQKFSFVGSFVFDAGLVDVIKYIPGSRNYGSGLIFGIQYHLINKSSFN